MTTAADFFQENASKYDFMAMRGMPRYAEMLEEVVRCMSPKVTDILELGCGTGALTALIRQRHPAAAITAVDAAPDMIEIARERVASIGAGGRVTFMAAMFEEPDMPAHCYDAIASNRACTTS